MRTLPLAEEHDRLGARWTDLDGWRLPADYGDAASEQRAVRAAAGVLDWSARGKIRVTGEDRVSYLDGLLTNDLKALRPGTGAYALSLDHKGRVHGDLTVHHLGDAFLLETDPGAREPVQTHLEKLLVSDDATLADVTDGTVLLGVFGPDSASIVKAVVGIDPPSGDYDHASAPVRGSTVRVARSPGFGISGYTIWIPPGPLGADLWTSLRNEGAVPVGTDAADVLRIEAGRPRYGVDMGVDTLALEARLESAISWTKGCYLGQEVVSRATYVGQVNRLLVGFLIEGDRVPPPGTSVTANGAVVGKVTSSARSAALGRIIALGYVRRLHADPGTPVTLDDELGTATVAALPFVP